MVKVSPGLKKAIEGASGAQDMDMSKWAREVLAKAAGYDLSVDNALDGRGRPRQYTSEKERNQARAKAERERQDRARAVVAAVMRQERLADINELEAYLAARGISLTDEGSATAD